MPDISSDKSTAVAYPPTSLYDAWCDHADTLDLSISRFVIKMVEAGRTGISMEQAPSESVRNLLQQKADLEQEIARQRERINDLEHQLQTSSQSEVVVFVDDNPGVSTPEIIQHIADTVPGRVASHLDTLEGRVIERRNNKYYPIASGESSDSSYEEQQ